MHRKSGRSHNEKTNEEKKIENQCIRKHQRKKITSNRKKKSMAAGFFFYLDNLIERIILRLRIPREEFFKEFTSSHLFQIPMFVLIRINL